MQSIVLWGTLNQLLGSSTTSKSVKTSTFALEFPQYGNKADGRIVCDAFGKTAEKASDLGEGGTAIFQGYLDTYEAVGEKITKLIVMNIVIPEEVNQCAIVGNMGLDPDLRWTTNGNCITNTRLAVRKKKANADPNWLSVAFFGKAAETLGNFGKKGSQVGAIGRLVHERWKAQDGTEKEGIKIEAYEVSLLGRKPQEDSQDAPDPPKSTYPKQVPPQVASDDVPW